MNFCCPNWGTQTSRLSAFKLASNWHWDATGSSRREEPARSPGTTAGKWRNHYVGPTKHPRNKVRLWDACFQRRRLVVTSNDWSGRDNRRSVWRRCLCISVSWSSSKSWRLVEAPSVGEIDVPPGFLKANRRCLERQKPELTKVSAEKW